MQYELGIVGAGNMAEAIVRGVIRAGLLRAEQIFAADPDEKRREVFAELGARTVGWPGDVAKAGPRMLLLSVKPQHMEAVVDDMAANLPVQTLIVSIAAGVRTQFIESRLRAGEPWRVVRTMPNTPMLIGLGMVAIAPGSNATPQDLADARRLFESSAIVIDVPEEKMNAVTALSGSGPAYFFYLAEHMLRAASELGMTPQEAHTLVTQTALGACTMLRSSSDSPQELRRRVTSPGGTTQAAIDVLESRKAGQAIIDALKAAAHRGQELGG
jgi:pyrroline-5-carboxylate reductase